MVDQYSRLTLATQASNSTGESPALSAPVGCERVPTGTQRRSESVVTDGYTACISPVASTPVPSTAVSSADSGLSGATADGASTVATGGPPALVSINVIKSSPGGDSILPATPPGHGERIATAGRRIKSTRAFGRWLREEGHTLTNPSGLLEGEILAKRLESCNSEAIAKRLESCGGWVQYNHYHSHPEQPVRLANGMFCQLALACPFCAAGRGARHARKICDCAVTRLHQQPGLVPYLLTLTQRNTESLVASVETMKAALTLLVDRRRKYFNNVRSTRRRFSFLALFDGGVFSAETKRGKYSKAWHHHVHAIVLGPVGLRNDQIYPEWSEIMGYQASTDLRPCRCSVVLDGSQGVQSPEFLAAIKKDLLEVCKYPTKVDDREGLAVDDREAAFRDRWEAFQVLRGRRLIRKFGSFYRLQIDEEVTEQTEDLDDYAYRVLVYKYNMGSGSLEFSQTMERSAVASPHKVVGGEWVY